MGRPQRRKGNFSKNKTSHRSKKTRNYKKDIDQIYEDNQAENVGKFMNQSINESLPGFGQFFCVSCSRYFIGKSALEAHFKTKPHKKQLKKLNEKPYTIKDSEEFGK